MPSEVDKIAKTFDSFSDSYQQSVNDAVAITGMSLDFFTRVKADYIVELSRSRFGNPRSLNVLDVGCGVGNIHPYLAPMFGRISGVDISAKSIEIATERYPGVEYQVYDGGKLPYQEASFDLAFTVCVMHHVPPSQWQIFASEMARVLKPGGLALVFEHNPRNPLTMRIVNRCPFDADAVLLRSEKTIALFERIGMIDVHARYILSVPAANHTLRRVDRAFGRLPFGAQYYVSAQKS